MGPRNTSIDQPLQEIQSAMQKVGRSTADIMEMLIRASMKLGNLSKDLVGKAAVNDSLIAQSNSKLNQVFSEYKTDLGHIAKKIEQNISFLDADKNTKMLTSDYNKQLAPMQAEMTEQSLQREKLRHDITQMIAAQNESITLFDKFKKGEITKDQLEEVLSKITNRHNDLINTTQNLLRSEETLEIKLDKLNKETFNIVDHNPATKAKAAAAAAAEIEAPKLGK